MDGSEINVLSIASRQKAHHVFLLPAEKKKNMLDKIDNRMEAREKQKNDKTVLNIQKNIQVQIFSYNFPKEALISMKDISCLFGRTIRATIAPRFMNTDLKRALQRLLKRLRATEFP